MVMTSLFTGDALVLFHHPLGSNAATIMEHVRSFETHSTFKVWSINTELGVPDGLNGCDFRVVILHYSLFGIYPYRLSNPFRAFLKRTRGLKIAFFQDEHRFCRERFTFLNEYQVDWVYTLLKPDHFDVYRTRAPVTKVFYTLPGYVSDALISAGKELAEPVDRRPVDIGYRARRLGYYMGKGAQEKTAIGLEVLKRAAGKGLRLDIAIDEESRLYGQDWYRFLAGCRAVLGVETGVSVFDIEDVVRVACEKLLKENPEISFDEVSRRVLAPWEDRIYYRTIGPRHFEAAALKTCQILFEGHYSGIMQPMVHYYPLKKDFSNFDLVLDLLRDERRRSEVVENAYGDLIASGRYSYRNFVKGFDEELEKAGVAPQVTPEESRTITRLLARGHGYRVAVARARDRKDRFLNAAYTVFRQWRDRTPVRSGKAVG